MPRTDLSAVSALAFAMLLGCAALFGPDADAADAIITGAKAQDTFCAAYALNPELVPAEKRKAVDAVCRVHCEARP
jgi:hypothetical protein